MAPVARTPISEKKILKMSSESKKARKIIHDSQYVSHDKRITQSEKKKKINDDDDDQHQLPFSETSPTRNCRKQLKSVVEGTDNGTCGIELVGCSPPGSSGTEDDKVGTETEEQTQIPESLIETLFDGVYSVDVEIVGGELKVIDATAETAVRIGKKFRIMKKLSCLVGCGLDCHFRMLHKGFDLFMLVRGAPKSVFGANVKVIPEFSNIRKMASPADYIEMAQAAFFTSILQLLPTRLKGGKEVLFKHLDNGEENENVLKLYEFLKSIRTSVSTHIVSIPIAWAFPDYANNINREVTKEIRSAMQLCGDNQLMILEQAQPGYADAWLRELGLTPKVDLNQMMDSIFDSKLL